MDLGCHDSHCFCDWFLGGQGMTHDPLCRAYKNEAWWIAHNFCDCTIIAKVRADMVQRVVDLGYYIDSNDPFEQGYTIGREMAIEVLSKAVVGS
jgi:hypothetical protein